MSSATLISRTRPVSTTEGYHGVIQMKTTVRNSGAANSARQMEVKLTLQSIQWIFRRKSSEKTASTISDTARQISPEESANTGSLLCSSIGAQR